MPYISSNFKNNANAPRDTWVGISGSPYHGGLKDGKDSLYGQCVTYAKVVTPSLPGTQFWKEGIAVKGNAHIQEGTVIATFNGGNYKGHENHTAIYVSQDETGIYVWDQYIARHPKDPKTHPEMHSKAIGPRLIRFNGASYLNDANSYYVVEPR